MYRFIFYYIAISQYIIALAYKKHISENTSQSGTFDVETLNVTSTNSWEY